MDPRRSKEGTRRLPADCFPSPPELGNVESEERVLRQMDPIEIPQWADGKRLRTDPVSEVLGDDNLLMEIIVRVGFPTTLIRAAFVCRRWLRRASDSAFLRRFRNLHPPRPLGFYVRAMGDWKPARFVPMLPQPPELGTVIHCANFYMDAYKGKHIDIEDCQNSNVYIRCRDDTVVHNLLRPDSGMTVFPPHQLQNGSICTWRNLVSKGVGGNLSYLYVWIEYTGESRKSTVHVYMLQDGVWCMHTSITSRHLHRVLRTPRPMVVDNKLYMASLNNILVLDLSASSLSIVQLPQGVVKYGMRNITG